MTKTARVLSLIMAVTAIFLTLSVGCRKNTEEKPQKDYYNYPPMQEEMPEVDDHGPLEFFSFDTEKLLTQLSYRDVAGKASVMYSKEEGRRFSRFHIYGMPAFSSGVWPAISIAGYADDDYFAPYRDCSEYDGVTFDIRNMSDRGVTVYVLMQDYEYVRLDPVFSVALVKNSDWTRVKVTFNVPEGSDCKFNKANMGQIQIWVHNLKPGESPIILDMDRMSFYKEEKK